MRWKRGKSSDTAVAAQPAPDPTRTRGRRPVAGAGSGGAGRTAWPGYQGTDQAGPEAGGAPGGYGPPPGPVPGTYGTEVPAAGGYGPAGPRQQGRSSGSPLHDYLSGARSGVDDNYVVLPRALVEAMPLPWQQQMVSALAQFHRTYTHLAWPVYRVQPSRYERLVDLDEEQLAEVGCMVEIDADGELVYRERSGRRIDEPESTTVLVSCRDPLPGEQANATENTPPRGTAIPQRPEA